MSKRSCLVIDILLSADLLLSSLSLRIPVCC